MVEIKEMSREFTKVERYLMTTAPDIEPLKNIDDGASIQIDGYLIFDDVKDDGEIQEIVSIITPDKKVYSGQSATFRKSLKDIDNVSWTRLYQLYIRCIKFIMTTREYHSNSLFQKGGWLYATSF